jgi:hypothetical protein
MNMDYKDIHNQLKSFYYINQTGFGKYDMKNELTTTEDKQSGRFTK